MWKTDFSILTLSLTSIKDFSIALIWVTCSSFVSEYIKILFIYTITNWFKKVWSALLIVLCIVADAFMSLNNIIRYSYILYFVRNAIFHSSLSLILMRLNASLRSSFVNYLAFWSRFFISFSRGSGYLSFCVRIFVLL